MANEQHDAKQGGHNPHEQGEKETKAAMDRHTTDSDRFKAFVNTTLDQSVQLRTQPIDIQDAAIANLRSKLDEIWLEITKHR